MIAKLVSNILDHNNAICYGLMDETELHPTIYQQIKEVECCKCDVSENIIIEMPLTSQYSYVIENGNLVISKDGSVILTIPLADIGDNWGSQVAALGLGLSGDGTSTNPITITTEVQNRLELVNIGINEINVDQQSSISGSLPYNGKIKFVVPANLNGYTIESLVVYDGSSTGEVLKNGNSVALGTTTVATGDVLSLRVLTLGLEFTGTITLKKSL